MISLLKKLFDYNAETGVITRKVNVWYRWKTGDIAGSINGQGYREIKINGKIIGAHRIAWMLHYGEDAPQFIDHINRNQADNRIINLRSATKSQNGANRTALSNNKTGVKGCYFVPSQGKNAPGRWRAQCRVNKKLVDLGRYLTLEDAKAAYNKFSEDVFGEFHCKA